MKAKPYELEECGTCGKFRTDACKRFEDKRDGTVFSNPFHRARSFDAACFEWVSNKEAPTKTVRA